MMIEGIMGYLVCFKLLRHLLFQVKDKNNIGQFQTNFLVGQLWINIPEFYTNACNQHHKQE